MKIASATKVYSLDEPTKYTISVSLDGGQIISVPLDPANRHYAAILKAVEEGTLVIQEAE